MKINDPMMDQVKACFTLTIELITKRTQNVAPGGKYLNLIDSSARATRLVTK